VPLEADDFIGGGLRRIAHPDPDQFVTLDHRIAQHASALRYDFLSGDFGTLALGVEQHAMIRATQAVTFPSTRVQRRATVTTAILKRNDPAIRCAIENDRLAEQRSLKDIVG